MVKVSSRRVWTVFAKIGCIRKEVFVLMKERWRRWRDAEQIDVEVDQQGTEDEDENEDLDKGADEQEEAKDGRRENEEEGSVMSVFSGPDQAELPGQGNSPQQRGGGVSRNPLGGEYRPLEYWPPG